MFPHYLLSDLSDASDLSDSSDIENLLTRWPVGSLTCDCGKLEGVGEKVFSKCVDFSEFLVHLSHLLLNLLLDYATLKLANSATR